MTVDGGGKFLNLFRESLRFCKCTVEIEIWARPSRKLSTSREHFLHILSLNYYLPPGVLSLYYLGSISPHLLAYTPIGDTSLILQNLNPLTFRDNANCELVQRTSILKSVSCILSSLPDNITPPYTCELGQ